jgi:tetratricopeptide (TPR) repeat protein
VLHIWDLNIRDDAVMQKIIPESPTLLRTYAQFLADKGLSLEARHRALARAERLEYEQAWKEAETGQNLMKTGAIPEALQHLSECLNILKKIRFFGQLIDEKGIGAEVEKKATLLRTVSLALAKAKLEENRNLAEAQEPLRAYLALESDFNQITALETYLKELNVIPENDADLQIKNIRQLSFDLLLMFKLHKYRQIISLGSQLQASLLVANPSTNKDLSEIFQMVGDSYLKLDFVYESEAFYQKALELSPGDPEVLFRMRKYYERRNDTDKLSEVDRLLAGVLSEGVILSQPRLLPKGMPFDQPLLVNVSETKVRLDLQFEALPENPRPLVSIYFNDRVYWEQYLPGAPVSLELSAKEGFNRLQVVPVNGPVTLAKIAIARL